jgi:nitrogen regulatory protein P-II 1
MRKVDAIFRPGRLDAVIERLQMIGAGESFVSEVRGFGRQGGRDLASSGSAYRVDFVVKVRLEWYGDDEHADAVARAIAHAAHTGKFGDGRIFVGEVDGAIEL